MSPFLLMACAASIRTFIERNFMFHTRIVGKNLRENCGKEGQGIETAIDFQPSYLIRVVRVTKPVQQVLNFKAACITLTF